MIQLVMILWGLTTAIIAGVIAGNIVVSMFTFSVPIIPKKRNNKSLLILAAIHIVLSILILNL